MTDIISPIFLPEDDGYHHLNDDPYQTETNWWSFNIPDRKIGCWIHAPYYPNRKTVTWRVFVWDDQGFDPARMAYFRKVEEAAMPDNPDLRDITFPGDAAGPGYGLKMIEPGMNYHLHYEDAARGFSLDFTHTGLHAPHRFPAGKPPFMQSPHFDQLGHVTGAMMLRGERIVIDGIGVRDRTWGPRGGQHSASPKVYASDLDRVKNRGGPRWREIEREAGRGRIQYIFGHRRDGTGFLGFVRPQNGSALGWSPMNAGWIRRDGVFGTLDETKSRMRSWRSPKTGWCTHMEVELTDDLGRTMNTEGFAVSTMSEAGYGVNQLMRWDIDRAIGWGEDQDVWNAQHFVRMLDALKATT
jgi:hypothetical protein